MQHGNKGQADQTGIGNLGPLILPLADSDQSNSETTF